MKKRLVIIAFILLVIGLMMSPISSHAAEPIKIAGIFALTGRAAHIGTAQRDAVIIAIDEANEAGGVNGRRLELVMADTESSPTKAVMALKKVLESEDVVAIIGPTTTGTAMAMRGFIEKAKIPAFMHSGGDVILQAPLNRKDPKSLPRWTFKSPYRAAHAMGKICQYAAKKGIKKIGFLYSNEGFGKDGLKNVKVQAPRYGIKIISQEAFEPKDVDMTAQLTRINAKGVDAIIAWTVGPPMGIIPKNAKQLGIQVPLFECHGAGDPIFWKVAGEAGEGVMMPSTKIVVADQLPDSDIQKKKLLSYIEAYRKRFNREPGTMVAYGADAAYIVVEAIKKVGPDRAKIRDAIENTRGYVGLSGIYNLSADDHNGLSMKDIVMIKATGGGWRLLE
ncbi:MAG: ABC transporter substrate-binding protein [Deltaproteobacteria bacterium]|nr:ABC transporter substrate-binding protein [Deltaproteobacteria bacterium]MBW1962381.1 ABC transporter substrate-binding protein [Deltaproteobacteria bacterium]MBW2151063.1 ABC transporter substrate-binding protein [Deltaproteobacteria bacterium]